LSNNKKKKNKEKHKGPEHSSPYPISRLAPKFNIIDITKEIETASSMLSVVTRGKLETIARQIKHLQKEAIKILEKAEDDMDLHNAECRFHRKIGQVYHLYQREDDTRYFSLLSPEKWGKNVPHKFVGSYLLNADMSWTLQDE
jgi:hypothetical protein